MAGSRYTVEFEVNGNKARVSIKGMGDMLDFAGKKALGLQSAFEKLSKASFGFVNISNSINRITQSMDNLIGPGLVLNQQMHDLSAITGITGKDLKQMEGYARRLSKEFGGSAADSAEAFKLVLSQLGPEIAKDQAALYNMGHAIKTTSKLMGGDTTAAAEVLTTAMNQYQVSLKDPLAASEKMAEMMNVMAAAGQAGSAELPAIKEALSQSGMVAKTAGVKFEELNAAIQALDKAGKKGAEGGVALRNVISTLNKGRFLPKDVKEELSAAGVSIRSLTDKTATLTDRMRALGPIAQDQALLSKVFGRENVASAMAVMANVEEIDKLKDAITGTSSAENQAKTIMESDVEIMSRLKAKIDDVKIGFYNLTHKAVPILKGLSSGMQDAANIAEIANAVHTFSEMSLAKSIRHRMTVMKRAARITSASSGSLYIFSLAAIVAKGACHSLAIGIKSISKAIYNIPIIGWILALVPLIIGLVKLIIKGFKALWDKCEGFRRLIFGIGSWFKAMFENVKIVVAAIWDNAIKPVIDGIVSGFRWVVDGIVRAFNWVKDSIVDAFMWVWEKIQAVFFWIKNLVLNVVGWISSAFGFIIDPIKKVFTDIADFVSDLFNGIKNKILGTVEGIKSWVKGKGFKSGMQAYIEGAEKGSESFRQDQEKKKVAESGQNMDIDGILSENVGVSENYSGSSDKNEVKSGKIDLNNIKGSTNYSAIMAKLQPKSFKGLSPDISVNPIITNGPKSGNENTSVVTEMPSFLEEKQKPEISLLQQIANNVAKMAASIAVFATVGTSIASSGSALAYPALPILNPVSDNVTDSKSVRFDKFCDKVEIAVPHGTTQYQTEAILAQLMKRLNDAVE